MNKQRVKQIVKKAINESIKFRRSEDPLTTENAPEVAEDLYNKWEAIEGLHRQLINEVDSIVGSVDGYDFGKYDKGYGTLSDDYLKWVVQIRRVEDIKQHLLKIVES